MTDPVWIRRDQHLLRDQFRLFCEKHTTTNKSATLIKCLLYAKLLERIMINKMPLASPRAYSLEGKTVAWADHANLRCRSAFKVQGTEGMQGNSSGHLQVQRCFLEEISELSVRGWPGVAQHEKDVRKGVTGRGNSMGSKGTEQSNTYCMWGLASSWGQPRVLSPQS